MARLAALLVLLYRAAGVLVVPSVVHQTYDYRQPNFFMYLSFMCVQQFLKPERHILWVNDEGRYNRGFWDGWKSKAAAGSWESKLAKLIDGGKIEIKFMPYPVHPPGNDTTFVSNKAHRSDFVRMNALKAMGGIYLDTDAFVIKSLDELRAHNFTLSFDNIVNTDTTLPKRLNNGVLLSAPDASFLRIWMKNYASFNPASFDYHSSTLPFQLATQFPDLVHLEMWRISPISYGFQTSVAAAAMTCGIVSPIEGFMWYPRWDSGSKKFTYSGTAPDRHLFRALDAKLVLHMTMSQVRGLCMMRKTLSSPADLQKMPSLLGRVFRTAALGSDEFDYSALVRASDAVKDESWAACRSMLGMHSPPPDPSDASRQQYLGSALP
jgi:Glycosyltransferase sugar-binding region containing DXD motif